MNTVPKSHDEYAETGKIEDWWKQQSPTSNRIVNDQPLLMKKKIGPFIEDEGGKKKVISMRKKDSTKKASHRNQGDKTTKTAVIPSKTPYPLY